jgi:trehalose/maltose transport system substrate-binding protein
MPPGVDEPPGREATKQAVEEPMSKTHGFFLAAALGATVAATPALAVDISFVTGSTGKELEFLKTEFDQFEKQTGNKVTIVAMPSSTTDRFSQYKLWLAAGSSDVDVYVVDGVWAPQLADGFADLSEAAKDVVGTHFPSIIASLTVNGKLIGLPMFADAPALYYRKDLLDKYGKAVPKTWDELTATATEIQDKERAAGKKDLWGFVFQGAPYEGLTCDALEWVKSFGGGGIVEADGTISINNPKAAAALDMAHGWINKILPPGVLTYQEEESRGVWQSGNAVFMRNWPYAVSLGNGADSPIKGLFDVAQLPAQPGEQSAATIGGQDLALSRFSKHPKEATELLLFMASAEQQRFRALDAGYLPTIPSVYEDPQIAEKQPIVARWKSVFMTAVPRPSAPTKKAYAEVTSDFWTAVHDTLAGSGSAADNLAKLEAQLTKLKGAGW